MKERMRERERESGKEYFKDQRLSYNWKQTNFKSN